MVRAAVDMVYLAESVMNVSNMFRNISRQSLFLDVSIQFLKYSIRLNWPSPGFNLVKTIFKSRKLLPIIIYSVLKTKQRFFHPASRASFCLFLY